MGFTVLFQLTFSFIYSTFSKKFSVSVILVVSKWIIKKKRFFSKEKEKNKKGLQIEI